ncbi:ABC transporter ATP-binding protein [Fusibacter ferrireducens]|uniref:ABC transporter ATP-binding protein n=1 Tax=Fusibacter ferrireducens TaxID=2785058 RepID=A0ABR9ZPH0_9FIRM|nr:ABC transporter ATP-binding protein [Fusibacter ferrireducens]MBF4691830.1 ABC transporter ATP-binding protein [Fusibacter ferrireducens]
MQEEVFVQMNDICKTFGSVRANYNINFSVNKGEIHALLGENGAGKSTLMNMLSGIYKPDSGSIFIHGKEVKFNSPKDAINQKIGMIHQHYKLVEVQSAKANIILGQAGSLFVNEKKISSEIKAISTNYGIPIDPDKKVYNMSIGEKQSVEILKVLYQGADILIMDEPTAVLTPQETEKLFKIIRNMAKEGCAVIIITHKLHEVMAISDRVTVLHKGTTVATVKTKASSPKELTDLMVGKSVNLSIQRPQVKRGNAALKVADLMAYDQDKVKVLDGVSFDLFEGEILGVAGVVGSGQKELCEAIAGLYTVESGSIIYNDENILGLSPRAIIKRGITMSFIPEDRLGMGLVASMDMVDNYLLKAHHNQKGVFLKRKPIMTKCEHMIDQLEIKTPGVHHPIKQLSGGNIQKVLIGREIETNPHVLITAYAVRGLDIGASHTIYDLINDQKQKGVAILFIGEDLDVLLELCDRIMVLCDGRITGIVKSDTVTKEDLGLMMAGEAISC